MRALRVISLASVLVAGLAAAAMAQRITTPGTYDVKICVAPGFLPQGGSELPSELQGVDPAVYTGTLVVSQNGSGYSVVFTGTRSDGATLMVRATFDSDWAGFLLGTLPVGSSTEGDCVTGIDVANLTSAFINGVGSIDGRNQRVLIRLGEGGTFDLVRVVPAPGPFRR
jgi:hypothetical protein